MNVSSSANSFADRCDLRPVSPRLPGGRIEAEISHLQQGGTLGRATPHERAKPREQLGERERLQQVVVGAGIEPGDAILDRIARREHQHRRPDAPLAQSPAHLDPVEAGQHQVEHDRVVLRGRPQRERIVARPRDVDSVPLLDEAAAQQARHLELVLDHEYSHARIVILEMRGG